MKRQLLSALLALCMVFTLLPVSAMAESPEAQWGVAAADGTKPAEWAGSGTLAAAVTYANELTGGTAYIQLLSDVTAATTVTFTQNTITLDLNGCTLSGSSLSGVIKLSGSTMTIDDSTDDGNGKVTSSVGNKDIGTINLDGGSLVVDGGTVDNLYNGGPNVHTIFVSSGNVTVNGGTVKRTSDYSFAYAINNMGGGTISVNGGIVTGGSYAIYNNDSGTVNVTGGEVSTNKSTVIFNKGTVHMTGGTVENTNTFQSWTIYNYGSGRVSIDGGEVRGSNPIFMPEYSTSTVNVTGGKVIASLDYAIESQGKGSISVTGGELIGRSCAIRCSEYSTANVSVTGGELTSTGFWTIFNYGSGSLSVADARVEGKSSMYGAIYQRSAGKLTIGGTAVVTSAYQSSTSGTIYMQSGSTLEINGGMVENTNTGTDGLAIFVKDDNGRVSIKSGSPVIIKAPGKAMTIAPDLPDTVVKTAAANVNGIDGVETYNPDHIATYKYLEFIPAVAKIGRTNYLTLQAAIDAVENDQIITLVSNTTEQIDIPGEFDRYFTLDLNGKTLSGGSSSADSNTIRYSGGGVMTITDSSSSGGGKITKEDSDTDNGAVIQSSGKGKILVNGKATISADRVAAICIADDAGTVNGVVLEIGAGTVGSSSQSYAVKNEGSGKVLVLGGDVTGETGISSTGTGEVIVWGGTIKGSKSHGIFSTGTVTLKGGSVDNRDSSTAEAIYCEDLKITPVDTITVMSGMQAMSHAPALPEDTTSYYWLNSGDTVPHKGPYVWSSSHTNLDIRPAYTMTYNPGTYGMGSQVTDIKLQNYFTILEGAIFSRAGYTQTGWATTDGGAKVFDFGHQYTDNEPITLYPVWTADTYAVTYDPGANGTGSQATDTKTHDVDLTLRGALFTRDGYTQTGWAATDGGTKDYELGGSYTANAAITVYPVWTLNTYAVTYHPGTNGTGSEATESKTHDIALTLSGAAFIRTGYTQTGWATTDGGIKAYELGGSYTNNEAITFYPVWTPDTYAVTYQPGENGTGSQTTDSKTHDIALTLSDAVFTRAGYTQTGWAITDGGIKAYELGGSYTNNEAITLYPVWTADTYAVTYHPGTNGTGSQATDSKTHAVALTLSGAAFTRTGYTQTGWATTDGGTKAYELGGSYTNNEVITLYPVWTPNTYAVTLPTGTGYTVTAQGGSSSPVTHGGSFGFTVAIAGGYHKGNGFAVKANGVSLAANGSGVYTISNITQAQTVTVEGIEQDIIAPTPAPPADTVYNDPSKSDATIWLTRSGFSGDDLLITQALTSGSDYNALLKLADGDVFEVYEISLQSGIKSTGNAMYLTFDLADEYTGQAFTLVHKKADGTFEYFYATAGADGNVKFGPLYELSPFMLVKGTLLDESDDIPKTGDDSSPWVWWLLGGIGAAGVALLIVMGRRKGRA